MGARTRRSLTLTWTALFVLSLLLQYFSFATAAPALAVHDEGLFELDGNTANDGGTPGDDWDSHPGATGNRFLFVTDGLGLGDDIFTGRSTKDDLNTTGWKWTTGSVQDKNDIEHAFRGFVREERPHIRLLRPRPLLEQWRRVHRLLVLQERHLHDGVRRLHPGPHGRRPARPGRLHERWRLVDDQPLRVGWQRRRHQRHPRQAGDRPDLYGRAG
jgi:hypothetical protein